MSDEWAEAMNDFREAVYTALGRGATKADLHDDIDEAEEE